jgi:hypothetical protein
MVIKIIKERLNMNNSSSSKSSSERLPIVFLGASAVAFFNMPEVASTAERLVGSAGVGVGASVGSGLGILAGMSVCAAFGAAVSPKYERSAGAALGAVVGAIGGLAVGAYTGYKVTKNVVDGFFESDQLSEVTTYSVSEQTSVTIPQGEIVIDRGKALGIIPA